MDSLRQFLGSIEHGRQEGTRLQGLMSLAHPLNPYGPQPKEIQVLRLWECVCAHHNVLNSGLSHSPESARQAAKAGGSNEGATQKLLAMIELHDLAKPHMGGELKSAGGGTCLKWLREWMLANGMAPRLLDPAPAVRVHTTKGCRSHWLDAACKTALDRAADPTDPMSVWHSLCGLAGSTSPPEPLMGMSGKSIKRRDGNGHKLYDYDAFAKYWKRRETPNNAA